MFDQRMQQQGDVSFISNPPPQYGGYPGGRRGTGAGLEKHKNPHTSRRSAQLPGSLSEDPGSNRYIPRNLLTPANHVSWSVEPATVAAHVIYLFHLTY